MTQTTQATITRLYRKINLSGTTEHILKIVLLAALLVLGTVVVYLTGGTGYAYPYVMLFPVMLGAAWYRLYGALILALIAGILVGPFMPQDVHTGTEQSTLNWLVRLGLYVFIGGFCGWLFQQMSQLMRTDRNTGLPNSQALQEDLKNSLVHKQLLNSVGRDYEVLVMNIRVLDLWEVMEVYGVEMSDLVIEALANELTKQIDFNDEFRVYRFSSSELVIQVANEGKTPLRNLIRAVQEVGEQVMEIKGIPVRVQLAAGSEMLSLEDKRMDLLLSRVRSGLFSAIEAGDFHQHYKVSGDKHRLRRIQLISRVRDGLKNNEFELFYQPKICFKKGQLRGNEALIRWRDGQGGYLSPGSFMPKIESTSLIVPVTRFVINSALEFVKRHPEQTPVSINFAANNLVDEHLLNELFDLTERAEIPPHALEIEITEGALIQDPQKARKNILQLRNHGYHVSIDDFGTGYSSFQYLTELPITGLKIDQAFVRNIESDVHTREVMGGMIDLAHRLHLMVIVEGVETRQQADILADLGADLAQGFYYARPMPEDDYVSWATKFRQ